MSTADSNNPFLGGIDDILEMLDDKMVRTATGSYIERKDLIEVHKQVREARQQQQNPDQPKPRTFAGARKLALADPEFASPPPPTAPAFTRVSGVNAEE